MKRRMLSLALALVLCLGLTVPAFAAQDQSAEYYDLKVTVKGALSREEKEVITGPHDNIDLNYVTIHAGKNSVVTINDASIYAAAVFGQDEYDSPQSFVTLEVGVEYTWEELCRMAKENMRDPEWASGTVDHFTFGYDMVDGNSGGFLTFCTVLLDTEKNEPAKTEQLAKPAVAVPEDAITYTVKKGETLSDITTNFYGNNAQRYKLLKANGGKWKGAGQVLVLPAKLGKTARIPAPVCAEGEKLYTVKAGDTLGKIARAEYGDVMQYKAIFQRNADRLKNANTIYVNQVIVLPAVAK